MIWLADTTLATGALIALVLVLRRPVAHWFGPGAAYALWALPLLRLVLPPLVLPAHPEPAALPATEAVVLVSGIPPGPAQAGWPFTEISLALWLLGAAVFLTWRWRSYVAMRRLLLDGAVAVGEARGVRLVETPATAAPVAFGVRDKVIALPPGFMNRRDRQGRDLAIAHELEHHAGRDLAVNLAMQPLLALHWFNPLAWIGWRALRRDQEAACDARVLAGATPDIRAAYARLIAGFAQSPRLALAAPMACPVLGDKSIVHRLRSLTMTHPSPRRSRLGRLLLGAGILALPLTATVSHAAGEPDPAATAAEPDEHVARHVVVIRKKDGKADGEAQERRIVIVDGAEGSTIEDAGLHTREIKRDGRTIILKTTKPLSEAEAEAHVSRAEAGMAKAEAEAESSERFRVFEADEGEALFVGKDGGPHKRTRTILLSPADGEWTSKEMHLAHASAACGDGESQEANATVDNDGKKHVVKLKFCSAGAARGHALSALRKARDKVAGDGELSGEIRTKVLEELDREIERLSKES